jgi:TetR/AcrR family transcriptional regulator, regulator of cefoperazone and chloramphenicol sensitivity
LSYTSTIKQTFELFLYFLAMAKVIPNNPLSSKKPIGDGARHRILYTALKLFAEQGFKKTSIRDIAKHSESNIASVSYYFGDKQGLYRAAFTEPLDDCGPHGAENGAMATAVRVIESHKAKRGLELLETFEIFYATFLAPLTRGEEMRHVMKLHFREMLEPTGLWKEVIDHEIQPDHQLMLKLLIKELGLKKTDIDVQRLALTLVGMAVHYFVAQDVVAKLAPSVLSTEKAIGELGNRLAQYAVAMVNAEKQRRLSEKK